MIIKKNHLKPVEAHKYPINVISFMHPDTNEVFYTPESDIMFHSIFGRVRNAIIAKSFLERNLGYKVGKLNLDANPEFPREYISDKKMVSDVKIVDEDYNVTYILEMQNTANDGLSQRFSSYAYKQFNEGLKKNVEYSKTGKVVLIVILSNNIPKFNNIEDYHTIWNGRDKRYMEYVLNENVTIHLIELRKYIKQKEKGGEINPWLEFIIDPLGEEVKNAMRTAEEFKLAVDMLNLLNSDAEVRDYAFKQKLAELDYNTAMGESERHGEKKGQRELIKKMIQNGATKEKIAEFLNIDVAEIDALINTDKEI